MPIENKDNRIVKTNATQRLVTFLELLDRTNNAKSTIQVLQETLGVQSEDSNRANLIALSVFTRMIEAAEREAHRYYANEWETVGPHFAGIRACFTPASSGLAWNQRKANLTSADLTGLRHTAVHLKRHVRENEISDGDTTQLREAIIQMEQALNEEPLSARARDLLLERLRAIETALNDYRFWGISGVEDEFREFVGTVMTDAEILSELKKTPGHKTTLYKKVMAVVALLSGLLGLATKAHEVAKDYLPGLEHMFLLKHSDNPAAPSQSEPEAASDEEIG